MSHELGTHQGKPVLGAAVKITRAGDGLSKPLAAMPRGFDSGTRLPVLLMVEVGDDTFKPVKAGDDGPIIGFLVKYNFIAQEAIVLDHVEQSTLDSMFAEQRRAVADWEFEQRRLAEEAKGQHQIPEEPWADDEGNPIERPEGMSDEDWEASARAQSPARLKRGRKAKAESDGD